MTARPPIALATPCGRRAVTATDYLARDGNKRLYRLTLACGHLERRTISDGCPPPARSMCGLHPWRAEDVEDEAAIEVRVRATRRTDSVRACRDVLTALRTPQTVGALRYDLGVRYTSPGAVDNAIAGLYRDELIERAGKHGTGYLWRRTPAGDAEAARLAAPKAA